MKAIADAESHVKTCRPHGIPSSERLTIPQLQEAYDGIAREYDARIWFDQYIRGVARLRKRLMSGATGRILDVACGTGQNLLLFPPGSEITAIDLSPKMLEMARRNAVRRGIEARFAEMDAERLEYPDASFDSVVSALSTCTFPDPVRALREMRRVCRPGGRILLLEHGRSSLPWLARLQDRNADRHYQAHVGCRWNQDPLELANAAGLNVSAARRAVLGIYHSIEATP